MKEYNKPYIEDEEIELEDVIAASGVEESMTTLMKWIHSILIIINN